MKKFLKNSAMIALLITAVPVNALAQQKEKSAGGPYKTGIGGRIGFEGGLTLKHFVSGTGAIEGIITTGWFYRGFRIIGLYEYQKSFGAGAEGLSWFAGGGFHLGFYDNAYYGYGYGYGNYYGAYGYYDKHGNWHPVGYRSSYTSIGIDFIAGLEFVFPKAPLSISLDVKPFFDLYGRGSRYLDGALSVRYTIK
jgi:hypothetical protein